MGSLTVNGSSTATIESRDCDADLPRAELPRVEASDPEFAKWILDLSGEAMPAVLAGSLPANHGSHVNEPRQTH